MVGPKGAGLEPGSWCSAVHRDFGSRPARGGALKVASKIPLVSLQTSSGSQNTSHPSLKSQSEGRPVGSGGRRRREGLPEVMPPLKADSSSVTVQRCPGGDLDGISTRSITTSQPGSITRPRTRPGRDLRDWRKAWLVLP